MSGPDGRFGWRHQTEYFKAATCLSFIGGALLPQLYRRRHRVFLIQDNASAHKKPEVWDWFGHPRRHGEGCLLPAYSPARNATEPRWHHTRKSRTHNRHFQNPAALCPSLCTTFAHRQAHPASIPGLLAPFC